MQKNIRQNWRYDTDYFFNTNKDGESVTLTNSSSDLSISELKELKQFEAEVKSYIYEGVSVQRIISGASGKGQYCLERRTLWLMLPEVGSLRLGFLSKETDGSGIVGDESDVHSGGRSFTGSSTMSNDEDGSSVSSTDVSFWNVSSLSHCKTSNRPSKLHYLIYVL